jgi:hypothetical protein
VSSESYPALDLMANWTDERPSMSQILEGRSVNEVPEGNRQIGDAANNWRSDNGTNERPF